MAKERVAVYVDGFNMYHALDALKKPHYKWLNLRRLAELLISRKTQRIVKVYYFTAPPEHFQNTKSVEKLLRHRAYTTALKAKGVICILGSFAERTRTYKGGAQYRATWTHMEEKKTDVALALNILNDAYLDIYDRALVVCVDTDQVPTYEMVRSLFPHKSIVCVSPPGRNHHGEIKAAATSLARIKNSQLDKALFGREVRSSGIVVAKRPLAYRP